MGTREEHFYLDSHYRYCDERVSIIFHNSMVRTCLLIVLQINPAHGENLINAKFLSKEILTLGSSGEQKKEYLSPFKEKKF